MANFIGIQAIRQSGGTIPGKNTASGTTTPEADRIVNFDDEIIDGGTTILQAGGLFTITSSGSYFISWSLNLQTGLGNTGPQFSIIENRYEKNGTIKANTTKEYPVCNCMKTGEISGTAILEVGSNEDCKLGIYNTGEYEASLSPTAEIKASITIHPYVVGSYSSKYGLIGKTLTLDSADAFSLPYENAVLFNKTQPSADDEAFAFNAATGELTLKIPGNYSIDWIVNIDGSESATTISFSLQTATGATLATCDSTVLLQNTFTGFTFIKITSTQTIKLVNTSKAVSTTGVETGADLFYSNVTMKAQLRVLGHS